MLIKDGEDGFGYLERALAVPATYYHIAIHPSSRYGRTQSDRILVASLSQEKQSSCIVSRASFTGKYCASVTPIASLGSYSGRKLVAEKEHLYMFRARNLRDVT
jgi:hypothetical protein